MDYQLRTLLSTLRVRAMRGKALCFPSLFLLVAAPAAWSASINYGDIDDIANGGTLKYLQVTESSGTDPVPLYGPPSVTANLMDFDPSSFVATSSGGIDVTDGQLSYGMDAEPFYAINVLRFTEGGDYSLMGGGSASVVYGISAQVTVLEIDNVAVAPFDLFKSDSGSKSLPGDAGILQQWGFAMDFNLDAALTAAGRTFNYGVTKAEIAINDQLIATSDPGNFAFIAKKNFTTIPDTSFDPNNVPEPTTLALAGLGVIGMLLRRKAS